jgi:hypothetical protein
MASTMDLSKLPPNEADFLQIWPYIEAGIHQLMDCPEQISPTGLMNLWVIVYDVAAGSRAHFLGKFNI